MTINRYRKASPGSPPPKVTLPPPKRPRRQTLEVFEILAEQGVGGPEGWFELPWRQGSKYVVELLIDLHPLVCSGEYCPEEKGALAVLLGHQPPSDRYQACEEARSALQTCAAPAGRIELLSCALRAYQLEAANSDGGGHAYNAVLLSRWHKYGIADADAARVVREARCADSVTSGPRNARAFREAWDAGLYRAACALG